MALKRNILLRIVPLLLMWLITDLCYRNNGPDRYAMYLDASKAFGRVNFTKLLNCYYGKEFVHWNAGFFCTAINYVKSDGETA